MVIVLGVLAALFLAVLVVGTATGRVRVDACCPPASADLRMRGAFDPDEDARPARDERPQASGATELRRSDPPAEPGPVV